MTHDEGRMWHASGLFLAGLMGGIGGIGGIGWKGKEAIQTGEERSGIVADLRFDR